MHTGEIIDWKMFIFGGCFIKNYQRKIFDDLLVIDLSKKDPEWKIINPNGKKPKGRYGHICVKIHNKIIIHGGKFNKNDLEENFLGDLWLFDPINLLW